MERRVFLGFVRHRLGAFVSRGRRSLAEGIDSASDVGSRTLHVPSHRGTALCASGGSLGGGITIRGIRCDTGLRTSRSRSFVMQHQAFEGRLNEMWRGS